MPIPTNSEMLIIQYAAELEVLQAVAQAAREIIDYDRIYPDVLTGDVPKRLSDTIKKLAAALEKLNK